MRKNHYRFCKIHIIIVQIKFYIGVAFVFFVQFNECWKGIISAFDGHVQRDFSSGFLRDLSHGRPDYRCLRVDVREYYLNYSLVLQNRLDRIVSQGEISKLRIVNRVIPSGQGIIQQGFSSGRGAFMDQGGVGIRIKDFLYEVAVYLDALSCLDLLQGC